MTGPLRQRWLRSERHSGQSPHGSLARAATRSPGRNRLDARADFEDARAELMPEKLQRRLGLQPSLDAVVGQRRNALGQLRLGDARLHAQRLDHHVVPARSSGSGTSSSRISPNRGTARLSSFELPFRCVVTSAADEFLQRVAVGRHQAAVAAGRHDDLGHVNVAARIDADVVRREEIARARTGSSPPPQRACSFPADRKCSLVRRSRRRSGGWCPATCPAR